jgi:hypothetical protein
MAVAVASLGCSRSAPGASPEVQASRPGQIAADQLVVLEMNGAPPPDTSVTFAAGQPRTIILRHPPPDNSVFAELAFPLEAFAGAGLDSVTATVRPRSGVYGLDLSLSVAPAKPGRIRFKYPVHFLPPAEAIQRFGGVTAFERALAIAHGIGADRYEVLKTGHPRPDNVESDLSEPGTYLVGARR